MGEPKLGKMYGINVFKSSFICPTMELVGMDTNDLVSETIGTN